MSRSLYYESWGTQKILADRSKISQFRGIVDAVQSPVHLALTEHDKDEDPNKVNLLLDLFQDERGKTPHMRVVREAERRVANKDMNHRRVCVDELDKFTTAMTRLVLGTRVENPSWRHIGSVPTAWGSYGLILAGRLLTQRGLSLIYLSKPTSSHHRGALSRGGFTEFREYRYVNSVTKSLDLEGMLADLKAMPPRSVVMLQACGHNPTGIDPTPSQWKEILQVVKSVPLLPLWDSEFLGLASGDFDTDAGAVCQCFDLGIEFLCVHTTAKSIGVDYNIGNLIMVAKNREQLAAAKSYASNIAHSTNNSLSCDGTGTVGKILSTLELERKWKEDVKEMVDRMKTMRALLRKQLEDLKTPGTWNHITNQVGLFVFPGLSLEQCVYMKKVHHVYVLPETGQLNVSGINHGNVGRTALAVFEAVTKLGKKTKC